ncbi:hypothetical protein [Commensalibacter nepenthis]|uniref:Uncharacterized protein n=1 Tax=Commensalibacter nepenthis TaxID=3043872 RepID=A0ABT6QA59_9PROT|nr:hypothetical protein [Commensalibacter sp. TBRC 10068]MDI2113792.1 hypothetical protein [Commensalibacter sp. TBRC 10068]
MTTVFVAGSITIKNLDMLLVDRLRKIVNSGFHVVVGDANGVDSSVQRVLVELGHKQATVFSSSEKPRNNLGSWPVNFVKTNHTEGSRAFFTAKDLKMAEEADYGLMVWDTKSTGTLSNIIELLKRKKYSVVFVNKTKQFFIIKSPEHLDTLLDCMSPASLTKADEKIKLHDKVSQLKNEQMQMFI